ncbi:MAG: sigma-54 dependent transcriptional regulator [Planctomycetota bacterium]
MLTDFDANREATWASQHDRLPTRSSRSDESPLTEDYREPDSPGAIDLLLVDDEDDFRESAATFFRRCGYLVTAVSSGAEALKEIGGRQFDVAVLDVHMPEMDGVELLERIRGEGEDLQVLMLTGGATVSTAVASMKAGAVDYVKKPIRLSDLDELIRKAARTTHLQRENTRLKAALRRQRRSSKILGQSKAIQRVLQLIERVASSDKPVLIEGESGTGKELVARAIHAQSDLADKPLVVINCAALPESLLESELFGHEKGAFTGAVAAKPGLFEVADRGTLFIDEFGELAGALQAKLLRVIEDGVIRRLGSVKERRTTVRLIAATNRDLKKEVEEGRFREDLYYRLNVLKIDLPALRDRPDDIPELVRHFTGAGWRLAEGVMDSLLNYSWPGNVRQLINALERGKLLADEDGEITQENLPVEVLQAVRVAANSSQEGDITPAAVGTMNHQALPPDLATLNRRHVEATLKQCEGNKAAAARQLGISRRSLYRLLDKYREFE